MTTIQGTPSCILFADQMHVLYSRADGAVFDDYYDRKPNDWFAQNISQRLLGTPAATGETFALQTDGEMHSLFRDASGHVIQVRYVDGNGWHRTDLTAVSQAPPASSDPVALIYEGAMHVFYRDAQSQIAAIRFTGDGWRYENLSNKLPNIPAATDQPAVLVYFGQLHLVFPIGGGALYHLYKDPKRGWQFDQLMNVAKNVRPAAGAPFLMSTVDEFHVLYRDTSDAISHVYYANGWIAETLDSRVDGPPGAKGDPCGLVYDHRMRVFFRAKSDDIYEFYFAGNGKWGKNNLSALTSDGVGANGDPTTIIFAEQNHVVYRDAKNRLADLYYDGRWIHQVIDDKIVALPEVGKISLKNEGAFSIYQKFVYFDTEGRERLTGPTTSQPYPINGRQTHAPSEYGVPDGAEVWVYADVVLGQGAQAHLPCINRKEGSAIARFHISGTTQDNDVHFDGIVSTDAAAEAGGAAD
jgi:hypothetical protein